MILSLDQFSALLFINYYISQRPNNIKSTYKGFDTHGLFFELEIYKGRKFTG